MRSVILCSHITTSYASPVFLYSMQGNDKTYQKLLLKWIEQDERGASTPGLSSQRPSAEQTKTGGVQINTNSFFRNKVSGKDQQTFFPIP